MKLRLSNIEMLRIITMCGVIVLHYNNPTIGAALTYAYGINRVVLYFFESLFVCAVDLFILITGYFMCMSNKRSLRKPVELLFQVIFFSEGIYLLKVLLGRTAFSVKSMFGHLLPVNYFVILYITVYFISPAMNVLIAKYRKNAFKFLMVCIMLFSVWPTGVDVLSEVAGRQYTGLSTVGAYGSQWGYSIVNFCLMYLLGAYIRLYGIKFSKLKCICGIIGSSVILVGWAFFVIILVILRKRVLGNTVIPS